MQSRIQMLLRHRLLQGVSRLANIDEVEFEWVSFLSEISQFNIQFLVLELQSYDNTEGQNQNWNQTPQCFVVGTLYDWSFI